jgi:hypothetical protein
MAYGTVNADVIGTSVAGSNLGAGNASLMKNRIINGAMQVWQRGTSFTISGGSLAYTADRWYNNYQNGTYSQSTNVPSGFLYSMSVASSSSQYASLTQRIESLNSYDLVGQQVTVSFWALATVGGASGLSVQLVYPNAVDNYTSSTTIATSSTAALTGSWTKYSITFASLPSGVANGLQVGIFNTAGGVSAITYLITGVQLEVGSSATGFEYRLYNQELAACQRYFVSATVYVGNNAAYYTSYTFPSTMRISPTTAGGGASYSAALLNSFGVCHGQPAQSSQAMTFTAEL